MSNRQKTTLPSPCVLIVFPGKQASGYGWGGVFNATIGHIKSLIAAGAEVVLWTASKPMAEAGAREGAVVDYDPVWHRGMDPLLAPRCWRKARALKRRGLFGALHEGGRTGLWGRILFFGIPQAGVMHRERLRSYRTFRDLMVLSHGYQDTLLQDPVARGKRVVVGANALHRSMPDINDQARAQTNDKIPTIAFVGRIELVKGIDLLIDAAAGLKQKKVSFRILIAGGQGGVYAEKVRSLGLEDCISFPGWFDDPGELYAQCDIFCLPSRNEPFGLSLIEAMAHGLPVVASRCHGPATIIEDSVSGFLTPIGDVPTLEARLFELLENPNLRQQMGLAAQKRISDMFAPRTVGLRLLDALRQLRNTSAGNQLFNRSLKA
ncbi:MAG: glycosyltransferase family 4 protein [Opitutales bacterium]